MPEPVIQVHDLTKHFNGLTAVNHLSFNVYRGDASAFIYTGKDTWPGRLSTI